MIRQSKQNSVWGRTSDETLSDIMAATTVTARPPATTELDGSAAHTGHGRRTVVSATLVTLLFFAGAVRAFLSRRSLTELTASSDW